MGVVRLLSGGVNLITDTAAKSWSVFEAGLAEEVDGLLPLTHVPNFMLASKTNAGRRMQKRFGSTSLVRCQKVPQERRGWGVKQR